MIGSAPVVFKSKYQCTVSLRSAEAEYMELIIFTQGSCGFVCCSRILVSTKWQRRGSGKMIKAQLDLPSMQVILAGLVQ